MRHYLAPLAALLLAGGTLNAHALIVASATTTLYNINGTLADNGTVTGTLIIYDANTGTDPYTIISENVTADGILFNATPTTYDSDPTTGYFETTDFSAADTLTLILADPGSVLSLTVCSTSNYCDGVSSTLALPFTLTFAPQSTTNINLVNGILSTAAVAPVPEPSSLALLGTGVMGVLGAARHRARKV